MVDLSRRGFLKDILLVGAAPAILKVAPVMRLWVPEPRLIVVSARALQEVNIAKVLWPGVNAWFKDLYLPDRVVPGTNRDFYRLTDEEHRALFS